MRFRTVCLFILSFFSASTAISQQISGTVLDSATGNAVYGVTVTATKFRDTNTRISTTTDSTGNFKLRVNANGIRLEFSADGYRTKYRYLRLTDSLTRLEPILLQDLTVRIEGAEITVASPVRQKDDTTEYSAAAFKVNPDATAEDLVKKMPGITSENGKIKAQGEEVKKVTLDGKEFFGDDAQTALRNLPAEVVDKIQVFDRMSDQAQFTGFDDGNSVKSINIKTKNGKANGTFGKAYAGYGTDNRYQSGLVYNNFKGDTRFTLLGMSNNINQQNLTSQDLLGLSAGTSGRGGSGGGGPGGYYSMPTSGNFLVNQAGGISTTHSGGFNFNDKWGKRWTIGTSYFYNNSVNINEQTISRTYSNTQNPEANQQYNQHSRTVNNQSNHRINLRLEFMIDSNNSIIYTPTVSFQNNHLNQNLEAGTTIQSGILNNTISSYLVDGSGYNLNNNLLYRHKFKKDKRTLTLNFQNQINPSESESKNSSSNYTYVPVDTLFTTDQLIKTNTPQLNYSGRLTYTEPIGKSGMLQFDYRYSADLNATDKKTYNYDATSKEFNRTDTNLSNEFNTRYETHQPGLMYRYRGKITSIGLGTGYQYARLSGDQLFPTAFPINKEFFNLLPRLFMSMQFSKTSNLRVMYRSSTRIPSVSQFQEVINTSNPLLLTTGNPQLRQSLSNDLTVRFNKSNPARQTSMFVGIYVTQTSDYITNATRFIANDTQISEGFTAVRGSQITSPVNLNGYWSNRVLGYYGFPVKKIKSILNVNASYAYGRNPGLVNGISNISNTHNVSGGIAASSNISENLDFSLSYTTNFYQAFNSSQSALNNNYFNHFASAKGNYIYKKRLVLSSDVVYNKYSGLSSGFNQVFALWNGGVGYKFAKNNAAEFRISCYDILKQNRSISRNITESYVEDNQTKVLTRYFMATFTWNFRKFANGGAEPAPESDKHNMHTPGGNPPGGLPPGGRPPFEP